MKFFTMALGALALAVAFAGPAAVYTPAEAASKKKSKAGQSATDKILQQIKGGVKGK